MSKAAKPVSEGAAQRPRRFWINVLFVAVILLAVVTVVSRVLLYLQRRGEDA